MHREDIGPIRRNNAFATQPGAKVASDAAPSPAFVVATVVMASTSDVP
jgi:hypothetical protein